MDTLAIYAQFLEKERCWLKHLARHSGYPAPHQAGRSSAQSCSVVTLGKPTKKWRKANLGIKEGEVRVNCVVTVPVNLALSHLDLPCNHLYLLLGAGKTWRRVGEWIVISAQKVVLCCQGKGSSEAASGILA